MIDLYTWSTPNERKISIMLEEIGANYKVHEIDITKDKQFQDGFTKISPNNKIPAIVDRENGCTLMESGAILLYPSKKYGQMLPEREQHRWEAIEWLMLQIGGIGPMFGQTHHFIGFNKGKAPYAEERYYKETVRLYNVLERRLQSNEYLANEYLANEYSIADIATWPWVARYERQTITLNKFPNVKRWYLEIATRPAVLRGYDIPKKNEIIPIPNNN